MLYSTLLDDVSFVRPSPCAAGIKKYIVGLVIKLSSESATLEVGIGRRRREGGREERGGGRKGKRGERNTS